MTKQYFLMRHYQYKKTRCGRVTPNEVLDNYSLIINELNKSDTDTRASNSRIIFYNAL